MEKNNSTSFNLNTGTDLAFALVVFISFFSAFSSSPVTSLFLIMVIIVLGVAYVANGIYGFSYVRKTPVKRIKLVYFITQLIISGLIVYYGKGAGFTPLIMLPLVAHAVIALDQNWSLITTIGIVLSYVIAVWSFSGELQWVWQGLPMFFTGVIVVLIFTQTAVNEIKARERLEILASELAEANRHLSEYAEQVHELAIAQERNRFAREIHDGIGHYLTTINMQISAASALVSSEPSRAITMLEKAKKMASETLDDVRNSVYALRKESVSLDELPQRIEQLAESARTPTREVIFQVSGEPRSLSPQANLTVYRTAQETLNNAQKHSGAARIELHLDYRDDQMVTFTVKDDGLGAEEINKGYGLIGIQERVRLMNGKVTIDNQPGKGFEVRISLPVG
ncbi:MAG TPA: sensor histidine kinase [Anaerolineaceae bacterium]|nr:sensor histidine kinase [Anaerolineaceae bacterium]